MTHLESVAAHLTKMQGNTLNPAKSSPLESLPPEVIDHILSFLSPMPVATLLRTSRLLRMHAQNEILWKSFVLENIPPETTVTSPSPAKTWKELYAAHYPYWFLTRHRFWFSDTPHSGSLIVAEYDSRRGCIEAYRLLARPESHYDVEIWQFNPSVLITSFTPNVGLLLDDPVVKLGFEKPTQKWLSSSEHPMDTGQTPGIASLISLCAPMSVHLKHHGMSLWPPPSIPSDQWVRNVSPSKFRSDTCRPQTSSQASDKTFRLRKYMQWSHMMHPLNSVRMGEDVLTFAALPESLRQPTKQKPYQGLWVGDYNAHGCEFLLVTQRSSRKRLETFPVSATDRSLPAGLSIAFDWDDEDRLDEHPPLNSDSDEYVPSGRLEAIKLTGDINVPRGECTWFADDIGDGGLVRIVEEETFKGSRVVKAMGHVALQGFRDDRYIDTQMILISNDVVALYWEVSEPLRCRSHEWNQ